MIVSHEHRFIFLKTRKTAGTSVEIALSRFCGPRDIITPISPTDEQLREQQVGRGPQNYRLPLGDYGMRDWARLVIKRRRREAYNHMTAAEVRKFVGRGTWAGYQRFAVVRNPWDLVVSWYFWKFREDRPPLMEALRSDLIRPLVANREVYSIDGTVVADHVVRFENLEEELETIRRHIGLPGPLQLPRAKGGLRPEKLHYRDVMGDAEAAEVRRLFAPEIDSFGYEY